MLSLSLKRENQVVCRKVGEESVVLPDPVSAVCRIGPISSACRAKAENIWTYRAARMPVLSQAGEFIDHASDAVIHLMLTPCVSRMMGVELPGFCARAVEVPPRRGGP